MHELVRCSRFCALYAIASTRELRTSCGSCGYNTSYRNSWWEWVDR